jgi:hypothetical protein
MWTVGETFTDALINLSVNVISATTTGFQVKIICDCVPTSPPGTPTNFRVSGSALNSVTLAWDDEIFETGYKIYNGVPTPVADFITTLHLGKMYRHH